MAKFKQIFINAILQFLLIVSFNLQAQVPYSAGNLVVLRVGDGSTSLTNASTALFLDEMSPLGVLIQTQAVPTSGNNVLTNSGSASSEGQITRTPDGYYLILAGYHAAPGTSSIVNTSASAVNRKLLQVDNTGNFYALLSSSAFSANNIRSGAANGNDYWASGTGSTAGTNGIQYFGDSIPGQVSATMTNTRVVNVYNDQLYFSTGSSPVGIYSVGTGMPITSGQTSTRIIAGTGSNPSPYAFAINPASTVCYVADDRSAVNGGGVQKFTYNAGTWSLDYTLSTGTTGVRGLTVDWSGVHPVIYATTTESSANKLVKIADSMPGAPFTLLATAATNTAFRGVAFAPVPAVSCDTYSTTTVNAYTSYTWNGTTYTTPGTYTWMTTNAAGCDSIATLVLNFVNYQLQILHASDFEASTDAVQDAPRFAAIVDSLEHAYPNSITLSSGDNFIPSPFSFSGEDPRMVLPYRTSYASYYNTTLNNPPYDLRAGIGRADISIMNYIGVEASVLGNHDFDFGTPELRNIIGGNISGSNVRWFGAQFPYLSSNLNFTADPNMSPVFTPVRQLNTAYSCTPANTPSQIAAKKKLAPYCFLNENGEKIGVVGVTTPMLAAISSPGATTVKNPGAGTNDMTLLAGIVQPYIDSLINQEGCNKIILLAHLQQLAFEKDLATKLHGVDIIVAGGSHTLMADSTDRLRAGDVAIENYPYLTSGTDGKPVAIINTDGNYKYVGRLVVDFTPAGEIVPASIDPAVSGAYATDAQGLIDVWGANAGLAYAPGTRGERVKLLCDSIGSAILAKDGNIFGKTSVFLEGRRNSVRTEETNLGNLSAEANLWMAKFYDSTAVISIKNGGGIRSIIGYIQAWGDSVVYYPPQANPAAGKLEGDISQLDIENSLRFNNLLSLLTVDAAGLRRTLEHGVSATAPGATPGQFPQIAGVRFSFDPTLPVYNPGTGTGGRIVNAVITNDSGTVVLDTLIMNGALHGNPARTFRLVTLNFLAGGGDSYPFPIVGSNRIDLNTLPVPPAVPGVANFTTAGSEQDAFAEYTKTLHTANPYTKADIPVTQDYRIQNLTQRTDHVFPLDVTFSQTNVTCVGLSNGSATAIPVNAIGNVTYLWSNAQTRATISNLAAGTYSVTVTDSIGSTASGSVVITQPDVLSASSSAGSIACAGGTTTVNVSAAGGTMPYSGTGAFTNGAGVYTFFVTDANGCTACTSITITEPELFSWKSTQTSANGAEISAFDPASKRVFTVAGPAVEYRTLSNTGILSGSAIMPFGFTPPAGTSAVPNSVDIRNGIVAVSYAIVGANNAQQPGKVAFYNAASATYISDVTVGYLPDMVTFSPDGTKVLTADEAEANSYGQSTSFNPEGSVSIIDVSGGFTSPPVTIAGFTAWNSQMVALKAAGVRIYGPGATVAQDIEPEYLTFSSDGTKAFVTLQENNAIGELDIATATFTAIHPLGLKDHSLAGNGLDASDQDGPGGTKKINIQNWPVKGMYQPDAITSINVGGNTYFLTANEGDSRNFTGYNEEIRVGSSSYVLDPGVFPTASTLKQNANLGRLQLTKATGDIDSDGDFDEIHAMGARSFTIWNSSFSPVFDSQDQLEQITALRNPFAFNSDGTSSSFDSRSDNKGPEPEAVTTGTVNGVLYAFVGSERTGDLFVYDITNPLAPQFRQYLNTAADLGVEGVIFVSSANSPTGKALVIATAEVSKTVSVFEFAAEPVITLIGSDTAEVVQNATYNDEGATAVDRNGNDITGSIVTVSTVNTAVPGTYTVTCNVADGCGIQAIPVIRTVIVTQLIPASITATDTISSGQMVCYNAAQTITIAGSAGPFLVQNGGNATMIAGMNIIYLPGTVVEPGGYMHGYIAPGGPWCGAKSSTVVSTIETGFEMTPVTEKNTDSFVIYPNPTQGKFTIEQKGDASFSNIRIDVYGMQGNNVYSSQHSGSRKMDCNLEGHSSGLYHVRVNADGKISMFKLILTR